MNPNEKPDGKQNVSRPGFRATVRRLSLISLVMLPLSFLMSRFLYAVSVGNWKALDSSEYPLGRFEEWMVAWVLSVCVVFLASHSPSVRRLFSRRNLRRIFFGLACFVTLIALFYAEENWRGKRAWENYRLEREAVGDKFDRRDFIPPPVADDQNFAMTSCLASLFDFKPGTQQYASTNSAEVFTKLYQVANKVALKGKEQSRSNSWVRSQSDLPVWYQAVLQDYASTVNKTGDIMPTNALPQSLAISALSSLAPANAALDEIREASRRPHARFNIYYRNADPASILLPHLGVLRQLTLILQLRASASLMLNRTDDASNDINLMFYLTEATHNEPILISQLVRVAQLELTLQPLAQGLEAHQWSDAQLQSFQKQLEAIDFFADAKFAMNSERAFFGGGILEYFRKLNSRERFHHFNAISAAPEAPEPNAFWPALYNGAAPTGWFYLEQLNYDEAYRNYLTLVIDAEHQRVSPSLVRKAKEHLEEARSPVLALSQHRIFSALLLPVLSNVTEKTARAQTGANLAGIACALERYRLANGKFPPTLDALVPQFMGKLPHDVINGEPLHYRVTDDGQFVLYSVGWNEKDDGGTIAWDMLKTSGWRKIDWNSGDWVWRYPARR